MAIKFDALLWLLCVNRESPHTTVFVDWLNYRGDRYMMYTLSDVPLLLGLRVERYSDIIFTLRS